ncbi:MAG: acyl-CoA dehydrogenase [Desulfatibacillum sp.]|nr:acyl-CoA dehydrogenase [Desulfatibacillum sp.]
MAGKFVSKRNIKFLMNEVLNLESLTKYDHFKGQNKKLYDMAVDAALKLATDLFYPVFQEMDRHPPKLENGEVIVHPSVAEIMKQSGEGGWIGANFPYEHDGEQLPFTLALLSQFVFFCANYSGGVYPMANNGAAHLLISFGSKELIDAYVPNLVSGKWQGTMALTEPQAGSSLSDIQTTAVPAGDGTFRLTGRKVFISAGDHNCTENVVHLMLAKIEGAPLGTKGISLFAVPKLRNENGKLVRNDINVSQVFHKMGYRGTPITELAIGDKNDCHAWLVGEPHRGLPYMFQMMNEARLSVGLGATGIASAAYYAALDYTKGRTQGRKIDQKDPATPQVPIIQHADVKRMLLFCRSVVEGSLALIMQCGLYSDLMEVTEGEEKEHYSLLLDILTPMAKTYPSEMGILSTSQSLQCLGGYGYCEDFPLEQYYRDMRIHPIHEGTTAIQGMDLLGRKVVMQEGKALKLLMEEIQKSISKARAIPEFAPQAEKLTQALDRVQDVLMHLMGVVAKDGVEVFLSDATLFLEMMGIVTIGWQWLVQALVARDGLEKAKSSSEKRFYQGKLHTFRYFFAYELPKTRGIATRLTDSDPITVQMQLEYFED